MHRTGGLDRLLLAGMLSVLMMGLVGGARGGVSRLVCSILCRRGVRLWLSWC